MTTWTTFQIRVIRVIRGRKKALCLCVSVVKK